MRSPRAQILEWAEQGAWAADRVDKALEVSGVTPDGAAWRRFVSALLLWLGALLVAAGVIFFFAYNWEALGRFAQLGLAEGLLVAAVIAAWAAGPDRTVGKVALFLAASLTGALLALVGQTYQTGADPFELFFYWALLIVPWAAVSRLPALWLLLVTLLNLAVGLYFQAFPGFLATVFGAGSAAWFLTFLNVAALALWELAALRGIPWMQDRWPARLLAALAGCAVTTLGLWAIFDVDDVGALAFVAYAGWHVATYAWYRRRVRDLFVLAGNVLSVIVFVAAALGNTMLRHADAGGFLLIAVVVIAMSAAGAWWLRRIAAEDGGTM